jgi:hypothetical protein
MSLNKRHRDTDDFEAECRSRFNLYCQLHKAAAYHSVKRTYAEKAYEVIDAWLDYRDVQGL